MTQGEHGDEDRRQIHIRLEGGGARDLGALHRWLSREDWFVHAEREYGLRVAYHEQDGTESPVGPNGPPMGGLVTELVLLLAGAVAGPVFDDLYTRAKAAVGAWAKNSGTTAPQVGSDTPERAPGPEGPREESDGASGVASGAGPDERADDGEGEGIG